ncbi:hypothetical protein GP5015_1864 [gamma proteobacterium HTCC5015]|nr:hypothetical protein GP5015_1864 [gamma proteobacterium HTCC5015]
MTRHGACYCAPVVAPAQAGAQWLYDPAHSKKLDSRMRGNDFF